MRRQTPRYTLPTTLAALTLFVLSFLVSGAAIAQGRAPYGLDARPANATCQAFDRVSGGGLIGVSRAFPLISLSNAVALGQAPGNPDDWYVVENDGRLSRFSNDDAANDKQLVLDIRSRVKQVYDGGLINFVFHPDFPIDPRVFVNYSTYPADGVSDADIVLASFSLSPDGVTFDPDSEVRMVRQKRTTFHQGGFLVFDSSGMLVAAIGDGTAQGDPDGNAQNLDDLRGSVLRLDVDNGFPYSIPPDNPFAGAGSSPLEETWAWGLRNPYAGDIDTVTGEMWVGDVGFTSREEVNRLVRGGNFGWNVKEGTECFSDEYGTCTDPSLIEPEIDYSHGDGNCAVIGGVVYRGQDIPSLSGRFIFGDYCTSKISTVEYDTQGLPYENVIIASGSAGLGQITAFGRDVGGEAYVVTGSQIHRLVTSSGEGSGAPQLLSQTGCFDVADPTIPATGLVPFGMNAPLWSDGAGKRRWMALPDGAKIAVDDQGDFEFPRGAVLIKEFSMDGVPVETRLLVHHDDGIWSGYSYEWDGNDAVLLPGSKRKILPGGKAWNYPSRGECLRCHTQIAKFALGPEVAQLNGDFVYPSTNRLSNQLNTLNHIGLFAGGLSAPLPDLPALSEISSVEHSDTHRARSYLHSNCSNCHQANGPTQAAMDFRFSVPTAIAGMCGGVPAFGDLGVAGAEILAPGDPFASVVRLRPGTTDPVYRMPPIGTELVHDDAIIVLEDWIRSPTVCDALVDPDGDGLSSDQDNCPDVANAAQFDSDHDGEGDRCDLDHVADVDGDGLNAGEETIYGTNPAIADSDGDGFSDGEEAFEGTDPLDPGSRPQVGDPSLLVHYSFSTTPSDGVITDDSGSGRDGYCQAGSTCPGFVAADGQPAGAASLTGATDVVIVPDEGAFDFTTAFTAALWIRTGAFSNPWAQLIGKGDSAWSLDRWGATEQVAFTTFAPSPEALVGTVPVTDGAWHHIAIVFDGATKQLYIDGVLDGEQAYAQTLSTNDIPVQLGENAEYPAGRYDGLMDDVRVYDRALSAAEILSLTSGGTAPEPSIVTPGDGSFFEGGQTIAFSGSATDVEDGSIPASAYRWTVDFVQDGVTSPVLDLAGVTSGSFDVPTLGSALLGDVRYEVSLEVTDLDGASASTSVSVLPALATLDFASVPSGRDVVVDGFEYTTPFSFDSIVGVDHVIEALDGGAGSELYSFTSWSDAGAQAHGITVASGGQVLVATFDVTTLDPLADEDGDGLLNGFELDGGLDPFDPSDVFLDGDGDGLDNFAEQAAGTDPSSADTDGDGLDDGEELVAGTDPLVVDTDGDGHDDGTEIAAGSDPLDPGSVPAVTSPGLLLHYSFSATPSGGVITDESGSGRDGICQAGSTCPGFVAADGQPAGAASFTGANDVVVVPDEAAFDFTNAFTAALWIRTGAFSNPWAQLIGKGDSSWSLDRWGATDQVAFTTFAPSAEALVSTVPVTDGAWHHIAIVFDGVSKQLYIDGALDVAQPYAQTLSTNDVPVQLGENAEYSAGRYDGLMDDVRVYDRALSAAEILSLTSGGTAPEPSIVTPGDGSFFEGGQTVSFSGSATDAEDGSIPASAYRWTVDFVQDGVTSQVLDLAGVTSGSFDVPTLGSALLGDVRYEVNLEVTDLDGASASTSVSVLPALATLDFDSVPSGRGVVVDGFEYTTPFSIDSIVGVDHVIEALDGGAGSELYSFTSWSDAGAQAHGITVASGGQVLVATFDVTTLDPLGDEDDDGLLNGFELDGGLDPFDPSDVFLDGDGDGLDNFAEQAAGTDPSSADTDGDGLDDGEELVAGTDPLLVDTDGDGHDDGTEIAAGSDPLDPGSVPAVPSPGLLLHYSFSATPSGGVVTDESGSGRDGACQAGSTCPGFVAADGQPAGAASFTGANDVVVVPDEAAFDFTDGFTAALWIRTGAFSTPWAQLIGKGDSAWSLDRWGRSDQVAFTTFAPSADTLVSTASVTDGAWHHIAIVFDGASKQLYIDGVLDAERAYTQTLSSNDFPVQLGENAEYPAGRYDGLMDDVRVYGHALTPAEVADLAQVLAP